MGKVAILVMADTENSDDKARLNLAMLTLREFFEAGYEVKIIFEGAATKWIKLLANPDHKIHSFYSKAKEHIEVCSYCAIAYGVKEISVEEGLKLATEYKGHPSIKNLVDNKYEIITY